MTPSEAGKPAAGEALHFIHPGAIDAPTGGSLYDKRVIDELRRIGWRVDLHELPGRFPEVDAASRDAAAAVLTGLPDGVRVIVDGLALPAFEDTLQQDDIWSIVSYMRAGFPASDNANDSGMSEMDEGTADDVE